MGESKKKSSWAAWIIITIAFLALIYFFTFSFLKNGKSQAEDVVTAKMLNFVTSWGDEFSGELSSAKNYGGMIRDVINDGDRDIFDEEILSLAKNIVKNSVFNHIYICDKSGKMIDENGDAHDSSFYENDLTGAENVGARYFYLKEDDQGEQDVYVASYPLNKGYLLFFLESSLTSTLLEDSGYEELAFAAVIQKDGTLLNVFNCCKDTGSKYLTADNFLSAVQEGCADSPEQYNMFKSKLYNNTSYAIASSYDGDERTIICTPLDVEEWYIAVGIRQYQVDSMVKTEFSEAKGAIIKLALVVTVFFLYLIVTFVINITKSRERGKKLEDKADMDLLTELTNKAATERMIAEYMEENPRNRGVLFILDIDNFKKVNDTMGHAFGDTLLKTLGKEIRTEFRVTDIVGRTGGDEFMIFLKDIKDDLIVEREANRVNHFFHDFKAGGDYVKYSATASIGAAVFPEDGANFKDLYVSADQALYRAKKRGKNQLVFFNEEKYGNK